MFPSASAPTGLVGLYRPRALNVLRRRRYDVERVRSCLGCDDECRSLGFPYNGDLRSRVLLFHFRLSVGEDGLCVQQGGVTGLRNVVRRVFPVRPFTLLRR